MCEERYSRKSLGLCPSGKTGAFPNKFLYATLTKELLSPHGLPSFSFLPKMVGGFRNKYSKNLGTMLMYLSVTKDKVYVYNEECW